MTDLGQTDLGQDIFGIYQTNLGWTDLGYIHILSYIHTHTLRLALTLTLSRSLAATRIQTDTHAHILSSILPMQIGVEQGRSGAVCSLGETVFPQDNTQFHCFLILSLITHAKTDESALMFNKQETSIQKYEVDKRKVNLSARRERF